MKTAQTIRNLTETYNIETCFGVLTVAVESALMYGSESWTLTSSLDPH